MRDQIWKRKLQIISMGLALVLGSPMTRAESESPFGGNGENPPPGDESFDERDDFDMEDAFGIKPSDEGNVSGAAPPPQLPDSAQAELPSLDRDRVPPPPAPPIRRTCPSRTRRARSATPPPRKPTPAPAPVSTAPPVVANTTPQATPTNSALSDYLQLDSSVKGLQVKNFDLQEQDIRNVVKLISKWTGKNFILDQKIRGKITILGPSQVTLQEAYQAFLSALAANGLTTVQSGKFIRVIESAEARRAPVKTYTGEYAPQDDQFITRIFQLKYINADEVQREFRDMTTRQGKLFAYAPTNSVIITDTGSNIQRIKEILNSLDIPSFETTLHLIPIENNSSKKVAELLDQIYGTSSGGSSSRSRSRSRFRRSALERTRGGGIISKIVADEAANSLVVLANDRGVQQLRRLVRRLDTKGSDSGSIHVYYCQYAKAEDLAATLAALSSGSSSANRSSTRRGSTRNNRNTRNRSNRNRNRSRTSSSRSGPISADLEGVKITADAATNALVITASAADYQTVKEVIKKLDIPRQQVFVESAIIEVNVDDSTSTGVNLLAGDKRLPFAGGFVGDAGTITSIITGTGLPDGLTVPVFTGATYEPSATFTAGDTSISKVITRGFMGVINLVAQASKASILSTPQILAMDNEEATFKVLDKIPVSGGTTTTTATTNTSVETLESGINIKLTPHINRASQTIRLEIEQTVDSFKPATEVPENLRDSNRAITTRETNTTVVVKDKDYVVLGGLMSDQVQETATKVPLLGDIPVLGWLFKSKTWSKVKTNLILFLRPRIIGTTLESATLAEQLMEERDQFIDKNVSGEDWQADGVSKIKNTIRQQKERGKGQKSWELDRNERIGGGADQGREPQMDDDMRDLLSEDAPEKTARRVTKPTRETSSIDAPEGTASKEEDSEALRPLPPMNESTNKNESEENAS